MLADSLKLLSSPLLPGRHRSMRSGCSQLVLRQGSSPAVIASRDNGAPAMSKIVLPVSNRAALVGTLLRRTIWA